MPLAPTPAGSSVVEPSTPPSRASAWPNGLPPTPSTDGSSPNGVTAGGARGRPRRVAPVPFCLPPSAPPQGHAFTLLELPDGARRLSAPTAPSPLLGPPLPLTPPDSPELSGPFVAIEAWGPRLDAWLQATLGPAWAGPHEPPSARNDVDLAAVYQVLDVATCCQATLKQALGASPLGGGAAPGARPPPAAPWPRASLVDLTALGAGSYLVGPNPRQDGPFLACLWACDVAVAVALATPRWLVASEDDCGPGGVALRPGPAGPSPPAGSPWQRTCTLTRGRVQRALTVVGVDWPDFAAPSTWVLGTAVAAVATAAREALADAAPVAVHCGAGIGRSGTFVLAAALVRATPLGERVTLRQAMRMFVALRLQRGGAVETPAQFVAALRTAQTFVDRAD